LAVGEAGLLSPPVTPLHAKVLEKTRVKRFNGTAEDWNRFIREFGEYLSMVYDSAGTGLPLSQPGVLLAFQDLLDAGSAAILKAERTKNPALDYYAAREMIGAMFVKNARQTARKNWQSVRLRKEGREPTLKEWRVFKAEYEERRLQVDDWNDHEDHAHLMKELTPKLREKVTAEQDKRRRGQLHVSINCQVDDIVRGIPAALEAQKGLPLPVVKADRRMVTVACQDHTHMEYVLQLDGGSFHGVPVRVARADYVLTGNEIMDLVTKTLESREEARQWGSDDEEDYRGDSDRSDGGRRYGNRYDNRRRDDQRVYQAREDNTKGGKRGKDRPRDRRPEQSGRSEPPPCRERQGWWE